MIQQSVIRARRRLCFYCEYAEPCNGDASRKCICVKSRDSIKYKTAAAQQRCPIGRWVESKGIDPIPRSIWPIEINAAAVFATAADRGVGDTLHRLANKLPGKLLSLGKEIKKWWNGTKGCQCEADRERLNALYPYKDANNGT